MVVGPDLQITWLDFGRFSLWPWPWIFKVIYLSQNWCDCHETTSKHIDASNVIIGFDLFHGLDLEFSRSKMVWLPRNKRQTYRLNSMPQMWPLGLTLAITLTLNFQNQIWNLLYLNQKWPGCHEMKCKGFDLGHDLGLWIFKVKCV